MVTFFKKPYFSKSEESDIVFAIREAEQKTSGEIRVHLVKKCKADTLEEARKVFTRLGMHRTKLHNAVLILVCLESRCFAIFGDSGIHAKAGEDFWHATRDTMVSYFKHGRVKEGIVAGVKNTGEALKRYFPAQDGQSNELSDEVSHS